MTRKSHGKSRRSFLRRTAMLSLGTLAGGASATAAAPAAAAQSTAATAPAPMPPHGAELRGMSLPVKDRSAEGRFGVMFKRLPAFAPADDLLIGLGQQMEEQPKAPPATFTENDAANEIANPRLTTGFTFLGQFIDHDITFDTTPLDLQQADPDAVVNFRTPRYDLDAMYGRGPVDDPQLYDPADRDKLLIVPNANGVEDVPRQANGRAIIADPRNDQQLIIVQFHIAFMKFHNALVDYVRAQGVMPAAVFEAARRLARWHYQWAVIHDFLPRIVGQRTADQVYKERTGQAPAITLSYYKPTNREDRPFIPVEFSVAAYRFGHSITRPRYTVSTTFFDKPVSTVPLFEETPTDNNLNGSRPIPARLRIQWSSFFNPPGGGVAKPVRRIDAKLAAPLFTLPSTVVPDDNPLTLLAVRNLLRGKKLGLASGQQVAKQMRATVLSNTQLGLTEPGWNGEAPLWFYVLKEAELVEGTKQLGPVGGRIVAEVLVGLLQRDRNSYLYLDPSWKPSAPIAPATGQFTIIDLLTFARVWA